MPGANYTAPYIYTNLGQIWQGPVNGQGAAAQYLYCDSSHPHQLSGIYPSGTTCSTTGSASALYSTSYDAWGNETTRAYNNVTATLSYDALNHLVEYNAGSTAQEFYLYDAAGNRVLKRSITGTGTDLTVYAYGLQELNYVGTGGSPSQTDYYSLGGHLIGSTDGTTTTYDLTDAQGSVLMSLDSSGVQGEQVYGPYGNQRYSQGSMATDKGYTGQFHDAVSGLDYYNARYYDPVIGQFLSADHVQGNAQGADPYSYVLGNPETRTDPTGNCAAPSVVGPQPSCVGGGGGSGGGGQKPQPPPSDPPTCSRGYVLKGGKCVPGGDQLGGGSGGGTGNGCHGSRGYGASSCTGTARPTKPTCDYICQAQQEDEAANYIAAKLRSEAHDDQVWIDRLNSNEGWYWLGVLAGLPSTLLGKGGLFGLLALLFGGLSLFRARDDAIQIFTNLRDMLQHVASDFTTEGGSGWTTANILDFVVQEENYMSDQLGQLQNIDTLGEVLNPLFIGAVTNTAKDFADWQTLLAYSVINTMTLIQVGYLVTQ